MKKLVAIIAGSKATTPLSLPNLWSSKNTWNVSRNRNFYRSNFPRKLSNVLQSAVVNFRKLRCLLFECDVVERMLLAKIKRIIGEIGVVLGIGVGRNVMPKFGGVLFVVVVMIVMVVVLLMVLVAVRLPVFSHR